MTSKKSSVNPFAFTFLYTVRKNCWFPILLFLFNLFFHLYGPVIEYFDRLTSRDYEYSPARILYYFFDATDSFFGVIFTAGILIGTLILGTMIFRYIMNKSAVNVYFSLGVTRTTMFWAKFTAGSVMMISALVVPLIISAIMNVVVFGSSPELWQTFFFILVHYVVIVLFILSVVSLTFSVVGTLFEGVAFSVIYGLSPFVFALFIQHLFKTYLVGSPEASSRWASTTSNFNILGFGNLDASRVELLKVDDFLLFPYSSSLRLRSVVRIHDNYTPLTAPDYSTVIFWFIVTVAIMLFAWLAFKKRKTEIAGFMGANQTATFLAVLVISTFVSSTILSELIYATSAKEKLILCLLTALCFALVYIIIEIISLRSFKKIIASLWKYPLHLAIYFTFVIVFATGFFGYKTRMPEIDKIESVSISTETGDVLISPLNVGYQMKYYYSLEENYLPSFLSMGEEDEHRLVGGFTDKADIERALDIHKKLIDISDEAVNAETFSAPYGERIRPVSIDIIYHLKNGKTLQRSYFVADDEILLDLSEFTQSAHYKDLVLTALDKSNTYKTIDYADPSVHYVYSSEYTNSIYNDRYQVGFASPNLTTITAYPEYNGAGTLKEEILKAVSNDIEAGTLPLDLKSDSKIIGYIVFKDFANMISGGNYSAYYSENGEVSVTVLTENVNIDKVSQDDIVDIKKGSRVESKINSFILNDESGVSIPVYEDMSNTVAYLNEKGFIDDMTDSMKPVSLKLWNGEGDGHDHLYQFRGLTTLFNGMKTNGFDSEHNEFSVPIMPENVKVINDPETISEYESRAKLMYLNCNKGSYAQFIYADGSSTFAYIPE